MDKLIWKTEQRKISELVGHPKNPRKLTDAQAAKLTESIQKFDLVEIPAINLDNQILAGHQRLKVMALLGRGDEIIDVRVPNRMLTEQEAEEYLVRSNLNTGEWDWKLLGGIDRQILLTAGFSNVELKERMGLEKDAQDDDFDEDAEAAMIKTPQTKLGDIYEIGPHRMMCGNSCKEEDVRKLMGGGISGYDFYRPAIQYKL